MSNRRFYLKFLISSLGVLSLPMGALTGAIKTSTNKDQKKYSAFDLVEELAIKNHKTCVYFAGSNIDLCHLFNARPQLASELIYINDDSEIPVTEIISQIDQLIKNNISIDYVLIQDRHLKIKPEQQLKNTSYKILFCSELDLSSAT